MAELNPEFNNEIDASDLKFTSDTPATEPETPAEELIDTGAEQSATNEEVVEDGRSEQLNTELGVEDTPATPETEKPAAPAKPQSRFDARIAQLKEETRLANDRAFRLEQQLKAQEQAFSGVAEPKEEDFEKYSDYVKALHGYLDQQKQVEHTRKELGSTVDSITKGTDEFYRAKISEGFNTLGNDWLQKAVALGQVFDQHTEAYHAMFNSPEFVAISAFLGSNLAEAQRIRALDPQDQAREIIRLETRIQDGRNLTPVAQNLPKPVKPGTVSKAPAPAKQVLTGKTANQRISPERESMDQYASRRSKELRTERRHG